MIVVSRIGILIILVYYNVQYLHPPAMMQRSSYPSWVVSQIIGVSVVAMAYMRSGRLLVNVIFT